jgi:hypothetical protein
VFGAIVCVLLLRAGGAAGQVPPALPERWPEAAPAVPIAPPAPQNMRWYGWQTLLADTSAITLTLLLTISVNQQHDDTAVIGAALIGAAAFTFAAPSIHAVHGNWGRAGISLALRLGLSLVGAAIGAGIGESECSQYFYDHEGCAVGYGFAGLIAGAATALIVDAAAVAREAVPARAREHAMLLFTPIRSGGGLTLIGHF